MSTSSPARIQPAYDVPSVRISKSNTEVLTDLGFLSELAGTWHGRGFNLIARPDGTGGAPLFLELNQTHETLRIDPIGSDIPNRGNGVPDIDLFGLTYLQKISDSVTGGALHIEPGIWVRLPDTAPGAQNVVRMATIPHGNALLATGTAFQVTPAGGTFPIQPVNTAPFPQGGTPPAGGTPSGFPEFDLTKPASATNPRTPFGDTDPVDLPDSIDGVPMQTVINDPTRLLQAAIDGQNILEMIVIQIDTSLEGVENIPFLTTNANAASMSATFWIEKIDHPFHPYMQLQYVQSVLLNFPLLPPAPAPPVPFSWPHVSIGTLRKTFGGQ